MPEKIKLTKDTEMLDATITDSSNEIPITDVNVNTNKTFNESISNSDLIVANNTLDNLSNNNMNNLPINVLMELFKEVGKDTSTGITSPALALMKFQRAKELNLPWANSLPHMHIIQGKLGLDINILQAIISRPTSGISWKFIEEYKPLYDYLDKEGNIYMEEELPPNRQIVNKFSDTIKEGSIPFIIMPTAIPISNSTPQKYTYVYKPVDWRTTIEATRIKKNIKGEWTTEIIRDSFSWRMALAAGLPYMSGTMNISRESNWSKRRPFMIFKSCLWGVMRKIANDLIMGAYDIDDIRNI